MERDCKGAEDSNTAADEEVMTMVYSSPGNSLIYSELASKATGESALLELLLLS